MNAEPPSVSNRVVEMVATETSANPLGLPPLYESVSPDALDLCVAQMTGGTISFEYAGIAVIVDSDGTIRIDEETPVASD